MQVDRLALWGELARAKVEKMSSIKGCIVSEGTLEHRKMRGLVAFITESYLV